MYYLTLQSSALSAASSVQRLFWIIQPLDCFSFHLADVQAFFHFISVRPS